MTERNAYVAAQPTLDPAKLVFLDESGVHIGMGRNYGWAPVGTTPVIERPTHGKRITMIGAIAMDGGRALRRVEGYVDGDEFIRFLREDLGPALHPGDVVVMDGPRLHRVKGVEEALKERGDRIQKDMIVAVLCSAKQASPWLGSPSGSQRSRA